MRHAGAPDIAYEFSHTAQKPRVFFAPDPCAHVSHKLYLNSPLTLIRLFVILNAVKNLIDELHTRFFG
jgi:hypothetical protein